MLFMFLSCLVYSSADDYGFVWYISSNSFYYFSSPEVKKKFLKVLQINYIISYHIILIICITQASSVYEDKWDYINDDRLFYSFIFSNHLLRTAEEYRLPRRVFIWKVLKSYSYIFTIVDLFSLLEATVLPCYWGPQLTKAVMMSCCTEEGREPLSCEIIAYSVGSKAALP